ncbi:VCBS repeat-containing protein [bacterium]|nr:VCBS repeat-containing protein [bacterium]
MVSGDLNNDGRLDLLTYSLEGERFQAWSYSLFSQRFTSMTLALPPVTLGRTGVSDLIDFNNDGRLDLATMPYLDDENASITLRKRSI